MASRKDTQKRQIGKAFDQAVLGANTFDEWQALAEDYDRQSGGAAWRACVLGEPLCGAVRGGAGRDGRGAYRDNQPADAVAVLYAGAGLYSGLGGPGDFRSLLRHD